MLLRSIVVCEFLFQKHQQLFLLAVGVHLDAQYFSDLVCERGLLIDSVLQLVARVDHVV